MEERRNVPKLRFPGFTDPWEQRRLGELGSVVMCKRIYKDQTTERGDVPFFKIGTFGGEPDAFISNELFEKYQELYSFPKVGDILISAAGTIGRTTVYQGERAYFQDSNIVWLDHDDRLDNGFLLQYLNDQTWSSLEGSTLKRLYNKDILDARIALPALDEQQCVGSFFAKLDSLIALHQRELDHVKELKKGLLQKMFPKEGTNVPELRFPGFTDPWEQRRLGELGSVVMCKRIYKDQTTERGDVPFFKIGTFGGEPDAFISNELFEKYQELYSFPKVGDILISAAGTIGRTTVYQGERAYFQDSNIVWLDHDDRLDNGFLLQYLNDQTWSSLEGSTLKRLYNKDILDARIALPALDEQQCVGSFFAKLDSLIALHQRELDHVKELKKGLLQQMFV
ncbi:restriction endonuclease subunit S [Adlercreutzia sp. CNCM I-6207]